MPVKTHSELIQLFHPNTTGDITALNMRDFVDTVFDLDRVTNTKIPAPAALPAIPSETYSNYHQPIKPYKDAGEKLSQGDLVMRNDVIYVVTKDLPAKGYAWIPHFTPFFKKAGGVNKLFDLDDVDRDTTSLMNPGDVLTYTGIAGTEWQPRKPASPVTTANADTPPLDAVGSPLDMQVSENHVFIKTPGGKWKTISLNSAFS